MTTINEEQQIMEVGQILWEMCEDELADGQLETAFTLYDAAVTYEQALIDGVEVEVR